MKPISIQLYSLREEAQKDFVGVLKSVAEMGYKGVEPAGFHGMEPKAVRRLVEDLGMVVSSNHGPWPDEDNVSEVVDVAGALGIDIVVSGFGADAFADLDAIKRTADTVNAATERLKKANLALALHNHSHEFEIVGGRLGYDILMELCPDVKCQLDTYWAANFGACDPAEQVAKNKARTPLLHIKDGPLVRGEHHMAVGSGKMDIPACIAAADENVLRWLIVELDSCATDMTEAVRQSYDYLVKESLGEGNK
ncbi:MAG TPA: sugar phosphate isomerase/epimerase [Sumerlaeia bacterium]|nr:sugar phosphate isomerase/epimerase [Sumerlaeia bacterium]